MLKIISLTLLITGCVANGYPSYKYDLVSDNVIENTEKIFIGLPVFLSIEGSSARYNEDWIITAGHNYHINRNMIKHPKCDIALIKDRGENIIKKGFLYHTEKTFLLGYPMASPLAVHNGKHLIDFKGSDGCIYSAVTGSIIGGMSGGGVYNNKEELVGINIGYTDVILPSGLTMKNTTTIITFPAIKNWLLAVTGEYIKQE